MSFRVKLRIKSVNPCYPVKPAPASPDLPQIKTGPELLRLLFEAAKKMPPLGEGQWTRRWMDSPGLPDPRFTPTCTVNTPPNDWYIRNGVATTGGVQ